MCENGSECVSVVLFLLYDDCCDALPFSNIIVCCCSV